MNTIRHIKAQDRASPRGLSVDPSKDFASDENACAILCPDELQEPSMRELMIEMRSLMIRLCHSIERAYNLRDSDLKL